MACFLIKINMNNFRTIKKVLGKNDFNIYNSLTAIISRVIYITIILLSDPLYKCLL